MKNYLNTLLFVFLLVMATGCTEDDTVMPKIDTTLPDAFPAIFYEGFSRPAPATFNFENWTKFAQTGSKNWFLNNYQGSDVVTNHYLEFSSFGSGDASNIGWIISPAINLDTITATGLKKRLAFQSAQHHAVSAENKFELLVSSNFDGTNVLSATWTVLPFRLPTYSSATNYDFVNSGGVDLSAYQGNIHIAFRVTGNGTSNSNLTGGFQIDNINVF